MQTKLDNLHTQLEIINQFEALFASKNVAEFNARLGSEDNQSDFYVCMNDDAQAQTSRAFDGFNFANDSGRGALVGLLISRLKRLITETADNRKYFSNLSKKDADGAFSFFYLAIIAFQSLRNENTNDVSFIIVRVRELITKQKDVVQAAIYDAEAKAEAEIAAKEAELKAERQKQATEAAKAFGKKALYHAGIGTLFTVGAGVTTASVLMQFSPAFAVLIGVHLPVAALATLAVTGVAMAAAAAYLAYRLYHPAAVLNQPETNDATTAPATVENAAVAVPNALHAKLVTAGLMTSGLGLTGFSALMQFSPAFALLTGLQLPPVALIALAAVGALLISVAVYRLIKTNANAPKTVVETTPVEGTKQPTDTFVQRFYQFLPSCCFKFGGKKTEDKGIVNNLENDNTVTYKV